MDFFCRRAENRLKMSCCRWTFNGMEGGSAYGTGITVPDFLSQTLIRRELYPVVFKYCGVCGIVDVKEDSSALNALAFRRNMEAGDSALLQQVSHHEGESLPVHGAAR